MAVTFFGETVTLVSVLGMLAVIVIIITEMIKDLWFMSKIPTKLTALGVSFFTVLSAMAVYMSSAEKGFDWRYLIVAFFAAFVVGYLSINGWDTFYEIWERFVGRKDGRK